MAGPKPPREIDRTGWVTFGLDVGGERIHPLATRCSSSARGDLAAVLRRAEVNREPQARALAPTECRPHREGPPCASRPTHFRSNARAPMA